jgi:hypothetical protein
LSSGAKLLWVSWLNENARITAESAGLAAGFYAKLPAHVARFALILHAFWHPSDPRPMLSAERMADAIELGEFFRAHIRRFLLLLQAATPPRIAGTETRILRILRTANGEHEWIARATLYRRLRNVTPDDLTTALHRLAGAGEIKQRITQTATKPAEEYRFAHSHYSHYSSHRSPASPNTANNAKCETRHDDEWAGGEEGIL